MLQLKVALILLGLTMGVLSNEGVMTDLRVNALIEQRYAQTTVISTMKNTNSSPNELKFKMTLPKTAFISSLVMEIEGKNYTSTVQEKSAAKRTYEKQKERGRTTGLVEQRDDSNQKFEVSANVAAEGKVTFYLQYEELLRRVRGKYHYAVEVKPGHVVPAVEIDIAIIENEAIKDVNITELPGNNVSSVSRDQPSPGVVYLSYLLEGRDLDGSFSLTYDVDMHPDGGEVQIAGGYFVHHFSPEGLPKMPVHTIFVLDVSGSMEGGKLDQVKEAMKVILMDLKSEDTFELITFESDVKHRGSFSVTETKLNRALRVLEGLKPNGGTNLHSAYMDSVISIMALNQMNVAKQIVFLTDGDATVGITQSKLIRRAVREVNTQRHPIFGLAFGNDADYKLLKEISADNRAFARKIAVGENTQDQLRGFYDDISTPLVAEINIDYNQYEVESNSIVKQGTSNFYSGGEVVSAGRLVEGVTELQSVVSGVGKEGPLQFEVQRFESRPDIDPSSEKENFVARLWAYLMVQDLLDQSSVAEDSHEVDSLKNKALQIALKFNFVTKLTSLVVVRPDDEFLAEDEETESTHESLNLNYSADRMMRHGNTYGSSSYDPTPASSTYKLSASQYGIFDDASAALSRDGVPDEPLQWGAYYAPMFSTPTSMTPRYGRPVTSMPITEAPRYVKTVTSIPTSAALRYVHKGPLFVVSSPGMLLPFCFSLRRQDGAILNLIKDPESGIIVNGQVSSTISDKEHFTHLYLALGESTLTVTPETIHARYPQRGEGPSSSPLCNMQSKKLTNESDPDCEQFTWGNAAGKRFGDVTLALPTRKKLQISMREGEVNFVVVLLKDKFKESYLGFELLDEMALSSNTSGIIGEFLFKDVTLTSFIGWRKMGVSVNRWNDQGVKETSQVWGSKSHRRALLGKDPHDCMRVRKNGQGLLDRAPNDYRVPCLSC